MRKVYIVAALGSVALVTWGCTTGVISQDQADEINKWISKMQASGNMPDDIANSLKTVANYSATGFPWSEVLTGVGTFIFTLVTGRALPNRFLLGKKAAEGLG